MKFWHASIGKNTAHNHATEDILVNLDGDNLVGPKFLPDIVRQFVQGYKVVQFHEGGGLNAGTFGRVAYFRADFWAIGGYDEDAYPMGYQDADIINRLRKFCENLGVQPVATSRSPLLRARVPVRPYDLLPG